MNPPRKNNSKRGLTIAVIIIMAAAFVASCFVYVAMKKKIARETESKKRLEELKRNIENYTTENYRYIEVESADTSDTPHE